MKITIHLDKDCSKYNPDAKEGVLKNSIMGYYRFEVVNNTVWFINYGEVFTYDCVLNERTQTIDVFI